MRGMYVCSAFGFGKGDTGVCGDEWERGLMGC